MVWAALRRSSCTSLPTNSLNGCSPEKGDATMEDQEQIQRECLLAALKYFEPHSLRSDHPILMELQLNQEEQASYTHKFFVMVQDRGAIVYRMGAGQYAVSENIIPDDPAREKEMNRPFDLIIRGVPDALMEDLLSAVEVMWVEHKVFDEWGLRTIQPFPHSALNFHGPPGTGKTLAAHAIAHTLKRSILVASYAEIESKFHGEGPKNVKAIFHAAERDQAILFIDEADSLLSKRLTEVTQGSEQAINSMRSQLFICLQEFRGVVIFATNLIENYDKAFETRVRYLHFPLPGEHCRREIWRRHLVPQLPLAENV